MEFLTDPAEELSPRPSGITREGSLKLAFIAVCFAAAYIFICLVPIAESALGFFALSLGLYALTAVFALLLGGRLCAASVLALIFGCIVSGYRFINGSAAYYFPVFILSALCYAFFTVTLFGNHSAALGGRFLLDLVKGVAYQFISFIDLFRDLFRPEGAKRGSRAVLTVILALVIAFVLLVIVGSLLSYDPRFAQMMPKLDVDTILEFILKLHLAVPIGAMIYGLAASSRARKLSGLSTEASARAASERLRFLPVVVIAVSVAALLVMYVLFFISQWGYYMSAFTKELPSGYSAAEYAREGFFQLLAVACINALLLLVLRCFTKTQTKAAKVVSTVLSALLCAATLILIATAISKMALYIDMYDLTRDRLCATLFLVFLAVAFVLTFVSLFVPKMKLLPVVIGVGLVMLTVFMLSGSDKLIADYNAESYLSGKHDNIDVNYIAGELNCSGTAALIRLEKEAGDEAVRQKAKELLDAETAAFKQNPLPWYQHSIPYYIEQDLLLKRAGG